MEIFKVAVDLDGVCSAFSKKVAELMNIVLNEGQEVSSHPEFNKKNMWKAIHRYDEHTPFFYSLDKMDDVDDLFYFLTEYIDHDNIFILTASGFSPSDAKYQKIRWVRKHLGNYHVEVVDKSADKAKFATPTTILIDDREKSIIPFKEAGGIGILHTSAKDTIEQLKTILGV